MYNPQLDTFVQVAESGSFSAAAQALYVTPTAVIKQMNLLEARLGVKLFERSHRGLKLTRAGESFLSDARHIITYSRESVERARSAERGDRTVIRLGVSLMTPVTQLTELCREVHRRSPEMLVQVVSYENTPHNARHILAHLGEDIDVVAGIFDDAFLQERGCVGLPITRSKICCAVPVESSLAHLEHIGLDDLHGHTLMLIQRGWNSDMDRFRDEIWHNHPQIVVRDFSQYKADAFNVCANEGCLLASLDLWRDVHPLLATVPGEWDYAVTYGLMYSPQPSPQVAAFIQSAHACLSE